MKKAELTTMLKTTIDSLDDNKVAWTEKWKIIDLREIGERYLILLNNAHEEDEHKIIEGIEEYIVDARAVIDTLDDLK